MQAFLDEMRKKLNRIIKKIKFTAHWRMIDRDEHVKYGKKTHMNAVWIEVNNKGTSNK